MPEIIKTPGNQNELIGVSMSAKPFARNNLEPAISNRQRRFEFPEVRKDSRPPRRDRTARQPRRHNRIRIPGRR